MKCVTPLSLPHPHGTSNAVRVIVPCGKCGACLHNRRTDWSFRLKEELKTSTSAWFITMTYTDENLPYSKYGIPTINKKALQNFLKRVRKHHHTNNEKSSPRYVKMPPVRFYGVGEYGTKTDRPHYHVILYNIHFQTATKMDKLWPFGQIKMSPVGDAQMHYITKYHVNSKEDREILDESSGELQSLSNLRIPEFSLQSTKPGIGIGYVKRIENWHTRNNYKFVINNGYKQRIPRYYKGLVCNKTLSVYQQKILQNEDTINYWEEMTRLSKYRITNPSLYSEMCGYQAAEKLKKEAKNNLTI